MQVGERQFGLVVDDVFDTEEIVVKPLATALRDVHLFSGATILGDGAVVLIVEPNVLSGIAGEAPAEASRTHVGGWLNLDEPKISLLIVRAGGGAPKVVELLRITRLEQAPCESIEPANGGWTMQYRGRLTPVIGLADTPLRTSGVQPLLMISSEGYGLALAVDQIVDVVEERLHVELRPDRPGSLGAAVVAGQAVECVDIDHYLLRAIAEQSGGGAPDSLISELAA
jgi:two-component system chemotaxis sensor kinase CheA